MLFKTDQLSTEHRDKNPPTLASQLLEENNKQIEKHSRKHCGHCRAQAVYKCSMNYKYKKKESTWANNLNINKRF